MINDVLIGRTWSNTLLISKGVVTKPTYLVQPPFVKTIGQDKISITFMDNYLIAVPPQHAVCFCFVIGKEI